MASSDKKKRGDANAADAPERRKAESKGFLLRVDPATMEIIEQWAAEEFRSVNGQIQWIINDAINRYRRRPRRRRDGEPEP